MFAINFFARPAFFLPRLTACLLMAFCSKPSFAQVPEGKIAVSPKESDSVLNNPGIGFNTFQHFNGDSLFPGDGWTEGFPIVYQDFTGSTDNKNYPPTTTAYWRIYWRYLEPENGKFRWDMVDRAMDSARRRGQKLMLRIAPYGTTIPDRDVPDWYRKMVGPQTNFKYNSPVNKWMVDPEDPRYLQYFGRFIRELGKRYDGHPDLESVDLSIVGAWGEGAGSELLTENTMKGLVDAYTESFKKTPLLVMIMDEKTNKYAVSKGANNGWRADCLGDLSFWSTEQNGWTHMYDFYPQSIIEYGLQDVWKTAPVSFEICGTMLQWRDKLHYGMKEVKYIFDESLKWHISSFNPKSSPVPKEWEPLVNEWLKKMGYRFVLRRFTYPRSIDRKEKFSFESWWDNKGVAPCYIDFPLVIRFRNNRYTASLITDADIRKWMPGDNVYNSGVFLPYGMPAGEYDIEMAVLNKITQPGVMPKPAVSLAIEGKTSDGWYSIGKIQVK